MIATSSIGPAIRMWLDIMNATTSVRSVLAALVSIHQYALTGCQSQQQKHFNSPICSYWLPVTAAKTSPTGSYISFYHFMLVQLTNSIVLSIIPSSFIHPCVHPSTLFQSSFTCLPPGLALSISLFVACTGCCSGSQHSNNEVQLQSPTASIQHIYASRVGFAQP